MSPKTEIGSWMKFFPSDWLAGTRMLPPMARAAFIDLLCYSWEHGHIPNDPPVLARFCGMSLEEFNPAWEALRSKWEVLVLENGTEVLTNPKQEVVRAHQLGVVAARKKAADARWHAKPMQTPCKQDEDSGLRTQGSGSQAAGAQGKRPARKRAPSWEEVLERPEYQILRTTREFTQAWASWVEHCQDPGTKARVPKGPGAATAFNRALKDPALFVEAVEQAIANNYQGINPQWLKNGFKRKGDHPAAQKPKAYAVDDIGRARILRLQAEDAFAAGNPSGAEVLSLQAEALEPDWYKEQHQ